MANRTAPAQTKDLMDAVRRGDSAALGRLFELVYGELHRRAHRQLRQAPDVQTLNTTALVHEAFLKLVGAASTDWKDLAHFFGTAGKAMRQILIDHARRRLAGKRGGGAVQLDLDAVEIGIDGQAEKLLVLDAALGDLETLDARLVRIVELRFFAGLSVDYTARVLDISPSTVKRDWRLARAYLHDRIGSREKVESPDVE